MQSNKLGFFFPQKWGIHLCKEILNYFYTPVCCWDYSFSKKQLMGKKKNN